MEGKGEGKEAQEGLALKLRPQTKNPFCLALHQKVLYNKPELFSFGNKLIYLLWTRNIIHSLRNNDLFHHNYSNSRPLMGYTDTIH